MTEPTITCPNCKTEIKLTESLAAPLIESTRRDYERRLVKQRLAPGDWRVNVETEKGRVIGRVAFQVLEQTEAPSELNTIIY